VRLLSSVGADVAGLMLKTVKGLVAKRTLVRTRQVRSVFRANRGGVNGSGHHAERGSCHAIIAAAAVVFLQMRTAVVVVVDKGDVVIIVVVGD